jgi:hypothetical protein
LMVECMGNGKSELKTELKTKLKTFTAPIIEGLCDVRVKARDSLPERKVV